MSEGRYALLKHGEMKAVLDEDLERYLRSLGCLDLVRDGGALCAYCGRPVTLEDLYALFPEDGQVRFCCTRFGCTRQFALKGSVISWT